MAPELTADRAVNHTETTFRSRRQFLQKDEVAGFHTNLTDRPDSSIIAKFPLFYLVLVMGTFSLLRLDHSHQLAHLSAQRVGLTSQAGRINSTIGSMSMGFV